MDREARERFLRQMAALEEFEEPEDARGDPERRAELLQSVNRLRKELGRDPLPDEDEPGELQLHERARALGLLRPRR